MDIQYMLKGDPNIRSTHILFWPFSLTSLLPTKSYLNDIRDKPIMRNDKAFQLLMKLSEAALLEEEIFEEKDEEYKVLYVTAFRDEEAFIEEHSIPNNHPAIPEKNSDTPASNKMLKALYKKLALCTHPDINGGNDAEFKKIQNAFQLGDPIVLLVAALKHNISMVMSPKDSRAMMMAINERRSLLEIKKNTFRWVWGESDQSETVKRYIRAALQIDETKFQTWLKSKN